MCLVYQTSLCTLFIFLSSTLIVIAFLVIHSFTHSLTHLFIHFSFVHSFIRSFIHSFILYFCRRDRLWIAMEFCGGGSLQDIYHGVCVCVCVCDILVN